MTYKDLLKAAKENRMISTEGAEITADQAKEIILEWTIHREAALLKRQKQIDRYLRKSIWSRVVSGPSEIKYVSIKEFRDFGYLQEVNRLFLHPLGMSLVIDDNPATGAKLAGILDYRDNAAGVIFDCANMPKDVLADMKMKQYRVQQQWRERADAREQEFGWALEDIRAKPDAIPAEDEIIPGSEVVFDAGEVADAEFPEVGEEDLDSKYQTESEL